jgi:hypothetical protein
MTSKLIPLRLNELLDAAARLNSPHPIYRIALRMEARQHYDSFLFDYVEERIREFSQQRSADILIHCRKRERISLNTSHASICCPQEFKPKPFTLFFVSIKGCLNLKSSFGTNNYFVGHADLRSLSFNSSQEMPSFGFLAYACKRWSSSSFCASVKGIASGKAATLSQMSSANWIRSAMVSCKISESCVLIVDLA